MPLGADFYHDQKPPIQTFGVSSRFVPSEVPLSGGMKPKEGETRDFLDLTFPYVLQVNVCEIPGKKRN